MTNRIVDHIDALDRNKRLARKRQVDQEIDVVRLFVVAGLITVAIIVLCASIAPAASYTYDSASGYYYSGGTAYNRVTKWYKHYYTVAGYWYCGYYYPSYQTWEWRSYYDYDPVQVKQDVGFDAARLELIKIAAGQYRVAADIQRKADETRMLTDTAHALGLRGNFTPSPYSGPYTGGGYAGASYNSGSTVYGASQTVTKTDQYGQIVLDLRADMQQAGLLAKGTLDLANGVNGGYQSIVGDAVRTTAQGQARVAEINAMAAAVRPQPSSHTTTTVTQVGPVKSSPPPPLDIPKTGAMTRQQYLALEGPATCVSCHTGTGQAVDRFNITLYTPGANVEHDARVLEYIAGPKPKCPPKAPLSASRVLQVVSTQVKE